MANRCNEAIARKTPVAGSMRLAGEDERKGGLTPTTATEGTTLVRLLLATKSLKDGVWPAVSSSRILSLEAVHETPLPLVHVSKPSNAKLCPLQIKGVTADDACIFDAPTTYSKPEI
jgi:hypothetical protein